MVDVPVIIPVKEVLADGPRPSRSTRQFPRYEEIPIRKGAILPSFGSMAMRSQWNMWKLAKRLSDYAPR